MDLLPAPDGLPWDEPREHRVFVHEIQSPIRCGRQIWGIDSATLTLVFERNGQFGRVTKPLGLATSYNTPGYHSRVAIFDHTDFNVFGLTGQFTQELVGVEITLLYRNQYNVLGFMTDSYHFSSALTLLVDELWGIPKLLSGKVEVRQRGCPEVVAHPRGR